MTTLCLFHEFISSTTDPLQGNTGRTMRPQGSLWMLMALSNFILGIPDFLWSADTQTRSLSYHTQNGFHWGCRRQHCLMILFYRQKKYPFFSHSSTQVNSHSTTPLIEFWWIKNHSNLQHFLCKQDICSHICLLHQATHVSRRVWYE